MQLRRVGRAFAFGRNGPGLRWPIAWLAAACFCGLSPISHAQPGTDTWRVTPVSAVHKLVATAPGELEPYPTRPALLRAARGEWESFQVVVTAGDTPLSGVKLAAAPMVSPLGHVLGAENFRVFHERYVFVAYPSGNRRLERLWWPDALVPMDWGAVDIAPRQSAVFWIAVRVPTETEAANYLGAIEVRSSAGDKQLFAGIEVRSTRMPAPTMRATAALYYDVLREWYAKNVGPQSAEDWAATSRAYYDFLLDYRINGYDLPVVPDNPAFAEYARDPRVLSIRTPPLDSAGFAPFLTALEATGARQKAFYYYHDEPAPERYTAIKADGAKLHAQQVKQLVTTAPNPALRDAVDIWCPSNGDALGLGHLDLTALQRERAGGRETWWYTMTVPRAPYATWLLDDEAPSVRLYGWQMARWGINGFVYSMVHGWGPKPLDDLRSFAGSNGDGTLVYPGEKAGGHGPMPSIRLMLLRDAIEDYELLQSLPQPRRAAVTSYVVGLSPEQRIDRATDWQNGTYRELLFAALEGKAPTPRAARETPIPIIRIPNAKAGHKTDGIFATGEWPAETRASASFRRFAGDHITPPGTELYLVRRGSNLYVALTARDAGPTEWCAVELAPANATERWRFVVTAAGKKVVERHTREGRFSIEGAQWSGAARNEKRDASQAVRYEWNIPLALLDTGFGALRLNVLRRVDDEKRGVKYLTRAWPDDGDITRMPHASK